jgi:hypothetical protein
LKVPPSLVGGKRISIAFVIDIHWKKRVTKPQTPNEMRFSFDYRHIKILKALKSNYITKEIISRLSRMKPQINDTIEKLKN